MLSSTSLSNGNFVHVLIRPHVAGIGALGDAADGVGGTEDVGEVIVKIGVAGRSNETGDIEIVPRTSESRYWYFLRQSSLSPKMYLAVKSQACL